jgi:hypothetical protein
MKLLLRLRISTVSRFVAATCLATATANANLVENTVNTGKNLFGDVPLSIMAAGVCGSFGAFYLENPSGHQGFLPHEPFGTLDRADDILFGPLLPVSSAGIWLAGKLSEEGDLEETGEALCRGLLYTYGISGVLKYSVRRTRPNGSDNLSFPSGHAAAASCTAAVLWNRCGPEVGIPMSVLAVYTCISRVNLGEHFPSDVLMATAIGTACGIASSGIHTGDDENNDSFSLSISLSVDTEGRIASALW